MSHEAKYDWIRPLDRAANDLLEVLITEFSIHREKPGEFSMTVRFAPEMEAIWHRRGKEEVKKKRMINYDSAWKAHHEKLEEFFDGNGASAFHFNDQDFSFRFCSGGALPLVVIGDKQYYRLHWRDIHPVGWNITNGGSDTIEEMLHPEQIIRRELQEEMIVFDLDPSRPRRLILGGSMAEEKTFPSKAWDLWMARIKSRKINLQAMSNGKLPLGWLRGPDSLTVDYEGPENAGHSLPCTNGVFLNINAEDFGIEVDQAVRIELPESAVICDGELISGHLLNSPVGLFEVTKTHEAIAKGDREFLPDILFWDAEKHDAFNLETIVKKFLAQKKRAGLLPKSEQEDLKDATDKGCRFDLCPVTRNIIRRCEKYSAWQGDEDPIPENMEVDVFISFASEDENYAKNVRLAFEKKGRGPIFFSPESIRNSDFSNTIFRALDKARNLVVVGSHMDHLNKNWVNFEYTSFFNKKQRKDGIAREMGSVLLNLDKDIPPPTPLDTHSKVNGTTADLDNMIDELLRDLVPAETTDPNTPPASQS